MFESISGWLNREQTLDAINRKAGDPKAIADVTKIVTKLFQTPKFDFFKQKWVLTNAKLLAKHPGNESLKELTDLIDPLQKVSSMIDKLQQEMFTEKDFRDLANLDELFQGVPEFVRSHYEKLQEQLFENIYSNICKLIGPQDEDTQIKLRKAINDPETGVIISSLVNRIDKIPPNPHPVIVIGQLERLQPKLFELNDKCEKEVNDVMTRLVDKVLIEPHREELQKNLKPFIRERINELLGPNRQLDEATEKMLAEVLDVPQLAIELGVLIKNINVEREKNLKHLQENKPLCNLDPKKLTNLQKYLLMNTAAFLDSSGLFKQFTCDLIERAVPLNTQINTDGFGLKLLDLKIEFPENIKDYINNFITREPTEGRTLRTLYGRSEIEYRESTDPKKTREQFMYHDRNTSNLKQKVDWENVQDNQNGGLNRPERIIGFMDTKGNKREVRMPLDLTQLELDKQESIQMLKLILILDDKLATKHKWVCDNYKKQVNIDEAKQFIDESKLLQNLSDEKKQKAMQIAIDFVYKINREITLALLYSGDRTQEPFLREAFKEKDIARVHKIIEEEITQEFRDTLPQELEDAIPQEVIPEEVQTAILAESPLHAKNLKDVDLAQKLHILAKSTKEPNLLKLGYGKRPLPILPK